MNERLLGQKTSTGRALCEVLSGCWREKPTPLSIERERLTALVPLLMGSGCGALVWRRLRPGPEATSEAARALQEAHLRQALAAKIQCQKIARVAVSLRSEGVETLLVKGWATARTYPEAGMRPSGDIDLLINSKDKIRVEQLLEVRVDDTAANFLDIKSQVPTLYRLSAEALFARQKRVQLDDGAATKIAVAGAEDHLRILCLHFLKHGGWKPLWLCDIAAALEFRPASFNWDVCLGTDPHGIDQISCVLGLAHQLLGASIENTPITRRATRLPFWLAPAVLQAWAQPMSSQHKPPPLLKETLREGKGTFQALQKRWPNPIMVATKWQTPLNWTPLPAQAAFFVADGLSFLKRRGTI